jgi:protein SCO1/2
MMKTKSIILLAAVALSGPSLLAGAPALPSGVELAKSEKAAATCCAPATAAPASACCAVEVKPAPAACCAEIASVAPLSARSLYQLDSKWTNDVGATVELASLRGQPVVIAMFFASCGYACPVLVSDMQRLRGLLPPQVREKAQFVLVSFDTVRDTPEALKAFRERSLLDEKWTLVRGEAGSVQELAMSLGVKFKQETTGQFAHSNLVTVLNREGEIAHQRNGLMGDMSDAAKAVVLAAQ